MSTSSIDLPVGARAERWFYIETSWVPEGEFLANFVGHLVRASRPKDAEAQAIAATNVMHEVTNAEFFMSRRLTDAKAAKVRMQIELGTWEGWRF